jgi:hypothetical protein
MTGYREAFVGIDAAKVRNAIAVADAGREGEIRYLGEVDASPESMRRLLARLAAKYDRLHCCYEAGPCCPESSPPSALTPIKGLPPPRRSIFNALSPNGRLELRDFATGLSGGVSTWFVLRPAGQ